MNKRKLTYAAIVIVVLGILGAAYMLSRPEKINTPKAETTNSSLTSNRYAEARISPTNGLACLEENSLININPDELTEIEYTSMSHVYDVPAGTNVDVMIASYSDEKVTGSNLYDGDYGNYNFVLSKNNGEWAVTEYKRCEL